jgi:hypothetical protein
MDESNTPMVCPNCHAQMTPCTIEYPDRIWDRLTGQWERLPNKDAWYCEHCNLVIEDDDLPF